MTVSIFDIFEHPYGFFKRVTNTCTPTRIVTFNVV